MDVYENSYQSHFIPNSSDITNDVTTTTPDSERQVSSNIFDNLPCLVKPNPKLLCNELNAYFAADIENVTDALEWWIKKCTSFPHLSCMAIDYLSIPGKSFMHSSLWY